LQFCLAPAAAAQNAATPSTPWFGAFETAFFAPCDGPRGQLPRSAACTQKGLHRGRNNERKQVPSLCGTASETVVGAVHARNRLQQRVVPNAFIEIHGLDNSRIEACQEHVADDDDFNVPPFVVGLGAFGFSLGEKAFARFHMI
jgi:hypothetical protein